MSFVSELSFISVVGSGALAVGALVRRRRTLGDWSFSFGMLALAVEDACIGFAANPLLTPSDMVVWQQWRLCAESFLPGVWLLFSLSYARGNAREFVSKWRTHLALAFLIPPALALVFREDLVDGLARVGGSGGALHWVYHLGWSGVVLNVLILAASIVILLNMERTFRASVGTMRWRIKFMLMGVGLLFVVRVYTTSQGMLFRAVDLSVESLSSGTVLLASLLALRSFFRTGRIDLDVYPSHSLLQGSLTVLLSGIYLTIVGIGAKLIAQLGGGEVFGYEALLILISLVLLAILVQSDRVRMSLSRFVSRHFQRPLYDYRTVWRRFTEGTATQMDQPELCRSVVKLVAEVFQSLSVAIWLVDDRKEAMTLAASTFLSESKAREMAPDKAETGEVFAYFREHPGPLDLEASTSHCATLVRKMHPSQFLDGENRVCLPLMAHGEVVALMIVGDHVGGIAFSTQDFDMLKCVGDHVTASLLNVQLSRRILEAKELEAFQTMAAFFVHDLKNAASTLSLMLKNLPVHFEDPAFREDALRGVSKSVSHINHVIGRISLLRHELKIRPVETNLDELVEESIAGLESKPDFSIVREYGSPPRLTLDREQIAKVVTNLVLNAKEAMAGRGSVRISTESRSSWVVLSVSDTGCGMAPEFISRSLFRPFQTTKKNGLGIGMFQSKMIVDVHGGRIEVASNPGQGSTFKVFLPVQTTTG
jgi:putative PEP-CTERM system histidine kinase